MGKREQEVPGTQGSCEQRNWISFKESNELQSCACWSSRPSVLTFTFGYTWNKFQEKKNMSKYKENWQLSIKIFQRSKTHFVFFVIKSLAILFWMKLSLSMMTSGGGFIALLWSKTTAETVKTGAFVKWAIQGEKSVLMDGYGTEFWNWKVCKRVNCVMRQLSRRNFKKARAMVWFGQRLNWCICSAFGNRLGPTNHFFLAMHWSESDTQQINDILLISF